MRRTGITRAVSFAVLVWVWCGADGVTAQSGTVIWSEPVQLSDPNVSAWAPVAVADVAGNVHVMWQQAADDDLAQADRDCLVYTRWDGESWSPPVDVLVTPGGDAEFPDLAVTPDGTLHAVWGTGGRDSSLMYSCAPVCCASDPRNWSEPVWLGGPVNLTASLVADDFDRLHAVFASSETDNIVYRRSDDGGGTWPLWVDIVGPAYLDDEYPAYPRLAVDTRGRVHIVWSVLPWPGRRVVYVRSDDGGTTWNAPSVIDSIDSGEYEQGFAPIFIDVEARGENEVHLIWDGAPTVERNHIVSFDGGDTWSAPSIAFPEITRVGRQGWNDMVVDSAGTLHAVALGRPLYANWSGGTWSSSTLLGQGRDTYSAEWMRLTQSLGNQLHVVWADFEPSDQPHIVWYVRGETSVPATTSRALPMAVVAPLTSTVLNATAAASGTTVAESGAPVLGSPTQSLPVSSGAPSPMGAVVVGIIPALLAVGTVLVAKVWREQRCRRNRCR